MKLCLFLLFLISFSAIAQKANVLIVDPDVDSKSLENGYNVQKPSQAYSLPDKEARDEVLKNIKSVQNYDELKKDILYMDLKSKSPAELMKKYPELSKQDIKKMLERQ
jgi:hypothetical protein